RDLRDEVGGVRVKLHVADAVAVGRDGRGEVERGGRLEGRIIGGTRQRQGRQLQLQRRRNPDVVDENGIVSAGQIRPHKGERVRRCRGGEPGGIIHITGGTRSGVVVCNHRIIQFYAPGFASVLIARVGALGGRERDGVIRPRQKSIQRLRDGAEGLKKRHMQSFRRGRVK